MITYLGHLEKHHYTAETKLYIYQILYILGIAVVQGFQNPVWELSRAPTISDMVYLLKHVSIMFRGDVSVDMTMMRHSDRNAMLRRRVELELVPRHGFSAWLKKRPRNSMEFLYVLKYHGL